jgi:5-methylcytosine-specific restriction endonuclease McrBC regulatory subunit McrC
MIVTVGENSTIDIHPSALAQHDLSALRRFSSVSRKIDILESNEKFSIRAKNYCGIIFLSSKLTIIITPKISSGIHVDFEQFVRILNFCGVIPELFIDYIGSGRETISSEAVFEVYLKNCQQSFREGFPRSYMKYRRETSVLKGKLDTSRYIRRNYPNPTKLDETYSIVDANPTFVAALRKCLSLIRRLSANERTKRRSSVLLENLDPRAKIDVEIDALRNLYISPHLRAAIETRYLSILLLTNSIGLASGYDNSKMGLSFLFETQRLFEKYVKLLVQKDFGHRLTPGSKRLVQQGDRLIIDQIPDVISTHNEQIYIHDAKWKCAPRLEDVSSADLRQLFVYSKLWNSSFNFLAFPTLGRSYICQEFSFPFLEGEGRYFQLFVPLDRPLGRLDGKIFEGNALIKHDTRSDN